MAVKTKLKAMNLLLHGWGYVEGRWVYVPLWDPVPFAFRYLVASAAIADAAKLVSNKTWSQKLHQVAGTLVRKANAGFTKAWEDGDPICPPWPWTFPRFPRRPIPFPWPWPEPEPPGPGPDPGPLDGFVRELEPATRNMVVGNMVAMIGKTINDRTVVEIGNEIMAG